MPACWNLEVKEKSLQTQEPYFENQASLDKIHVLLMFQQQPLHKTYYQIRFTQQKS